MLSDTENFLLTYFWKLNIYLKENRVFCGAGTESGIKNSQTGDSETQKG